MRFVFLVLTILLGCSTIWASCDTLEFARALETNGYTVLSVKYYEEALKENAIPEKEKDDIFLQLYKSCSQISSMQSGAVALAMTAKAESYFKQIKNGSRPEVQLEKVNADSSALQQIERTWESSDPKELPTIKKNAKEIFLRIAGVTDTIRKASRKWLDEYDVKEEDEKKKLSREFSAQSNLEINASLKFGEACVNFASILGPKDPEVRKWLEEMAKTYSDFISNNFGSPVSVVGGIYQGQVNILLISYKDLYGSQKDGIVEGAANFNDAIAGLEEFGHQSSLRYFVTDWTLRAYNKQSESLSIIGQEEKSIDVLIKYFEKTPLTNASPKIDEGIHDQMMATLQSLCKKLKKSYDAGNKKRLKDLMEYTLKGFNYTKKVDSRWNANFKFLLGGLPTDDTSVEETLDIAFMKADKIYIEATKAPESSQKNLYFQAALKYKKVIEMCLSDDPSRMDEMFPLAANRLGMSYMMIDNNLLALGIFLRAVDLYPSGKFPEDKYPEIYRNINRCAKYAKTAAGRLYVMGGKRPFDQILYEKTLTILGQQFPEEGGDPEYFLGVLRKSSGDYAMAIDLFSKIGPDSKMYYKAQYSKVECDDDILSEMEKNKKIEGAGLLAKKAQLVKDYEGVLKLVSQEFKKPNAMSKEDAEYIIRSKNETLANAYRKIGGLYYKLKEYEKCYQSQAEMYKKVVGDEDRYSALSNMILSSYLLDKEAQLAESIELFEKLKPSEDLPQSVIDAFKSKCYLYQANLVIKLKLNPQMLKTETLKGEALKEAKLELQKDYDLTGDLLYKGLLISGEHSEDQLKQVIGYYYNAPAAREKALDVINLYFKWYPNKPTLEVWYQELLGKDAASWDEKLGGVLKNKFINDVSVIKTYSEFLDLLFDGTDFSKMRLAEVKKYKKDNGDQPRNYQAALDILNKLEGMVKKDLSFSKSGWPLLAKLKPELENAKGFYDMRYMQAECLSILKKYSEASVVYQDLSHYYVEYAEVRIELAKAEFAQGNKESYQRAKMLYADLLNVVPGPSAAGYNAKEYFSLQWWNARNELALAGGQKAPASAVVETWKFLRSMVYQDLAYVGKDAARFTQLKIAGPDKVNNEVLIDDFKAWVDENIFPVIKASGGALAGDSWKKILGEDQ